VPGTPSQDGSGNCYHLLTAEQQRANGGRRYCTFAPPLERPLADVYGHVYRREWP
jgi:hypothetical protein